MLIRNYAIPNRTRELLEQMEFDGAKEMVSFVVTNSIICVYDAPFTVLYILIKVLSCRLCVSMAVERYVRDGNNDLLVAVLFEMAVRIYPEES